MARPLIRLKIDVTKIQKNQMFVGKKGTYLDAAVHENKDGTDQYGNDGFITQEVSKEAREAGEKGPIIGNWKYLAKQQSAPPPPPRRPTPSPKPPADADLDPEGKDLPF